MLGGNQAIHYQQAKAADMRLHSFPLKDVNLAQDMVAKLFLQPKVHLICQTPTKNEPSKFSRGEEPQSHPADIIATPMSADDHSNHLEVVGRFGLGYVAQITTTYLQLVFLCVAVL